MVRDHVRVAVRVYLRLPEDVMEALDRVAGPKGRSRYVARSTSDIRRR
jgi:hypothetical protein